MALKWIPCLLLALAGPVAWADEAAAPGHTPPVVGDRDLGVAKGVKKVAVASFVVQFVTEQTSNGGGVAVSFEKALLAEPGRLQAMTEAMYGDFRSRIAEAGYELVPHEAMLATPEYRTMQEKSSATPLVMETASPGSKSGAYKSHFHVPAGLVLNLKGDEYDNLKKGYTGFSQIADDTLTFAGRLSQYSTNWPYYDKALQKALGAATLHVRIFVPIAFTWSGSSRVGTWTHYSSGSMAAVRLGERFTRLAIGRDGDIGKIYLTEDVMTRGLTSARLVKETTNLFGTVTGREVDYTLDAALYQRFIPQVTNEVMKAFIARMKDAG